MDWFIEFIQKEALKRGEDKALLKIYVNMKNADCKNDYICTTLGISASKLQKIQKMAETNKTTTVKKI